VVANDWKDSNDKVMPVKQWLEERRFLQVRCLNYAFSLLTYIFACKYMLALVKVTVLPVGHSSFYEYHMICGVL
jgi:hypothetical protein